MRCRLLRRAQFLRSLRRVESGAMAIFIALTTCFVVIPLGALAVDIGVQRVARNDFQSIADTVALDMGRKLASGQTPTVTDAQQSAARNGGVVGGIQTVTYNSQQVTIPQMNVIMGYIDPSNPGAFISDQSLGCNGTSYNTYFKNPAVVGKTANAVLVTATGKVNFSIMGGSGGACRSAIATAYQQACVMMDSYAAALNSGDSAVLGPLNKMLGTSVDTTVLGSSGILTANLKVLDFLNVLKTNLSLGSIDQVLNANVTAAQVVAAEVTALQPPYNTLSLAANALASQIGTHIASAAQFKVSDLLGITQGGSSTLGISANPLDLAAAAVQLANGTNALAVSASSSNLTGLSASATVGSRPHVICLGDPAYTMAQTKLTATANINAPGSLTSAVGSLVNGLTGLLSGVVNALGALLGGDTYDVPQVTLGPISAVVSLASATGQVTALSCNGASPTTLTAQESSSLAPATVSVPLIVTETRHYGGVLGIGRKTETQTSTLTVTVTTQPQNPTSQTGTFNLPGDYNVPKAGPSGNLSVNNLQVTTALTTDGTFSNGNAVVGTMLGGLNSVINQVNTTLVSTLLTTIATPLFNALTSTLKSLLGVTIAGSTFTALPTASCNTPKLAG